MQIVDSIDEYITRLKKDYGLSVTLHFFQLEVLVSESILVKYNFHSSRFCMHLKSNKKLHEKCIFKQRRIQEKLKTVPTFTGVCHAGVKERVYGFYLNGEVLGFISVSGYKTSDEISSPRLDSVCAEFGFDRKEAQKVYDTLTPLFPDEKFLDSLIFPLRYMLEYGNMLAYQKDYRSKGLYAGILYYLSQNFTEDVRVETLAKEFFVSPSQISHTFKKNSGKSIREHILFLRIEYAKKLLLETEYSVTEIAMACGFSDCSYFCNRFKSSVGLPPNQYRNA